MSGLRVALGAAALLLFLAGVDVASRHLAENRLETRARTEVPAAGSIEADIDSFPFLPRLLASGSAGDVDLRLDQVPTQAAQLTTVKVELRDVKLDRDALFSRQVSVDSIEGGTVSAELDAASLSRAVGRQVTVGGGEVRSRVGPANVSARPAVGNDGALVLRLGPLRLTVALPRSKLLACSATRVAVVGDRVRLSCEVDDVPPALRRRLSS
ncbi:MAG TPA: LmeA family phospholipid-binding protein [Acidimicrobiales bacterium]|nr:LmeA family phospholipid-binding protein [Acidimicrobiales bacterium]